MTGERDAPLRAALAALSSDDLLRFLMRQRWFGRKGSSPTHARVADVIPLPWSGGSYGIARVVVREIGGPDRELQLPIGMRSHESALNHGVIATIDQDGRQIALYDAVQDADFRAKLGEALTTSGTVDAGSTKWIVEVLRPGWLGGDDRTTTVGSAEQSNTSIVMGGRGIYKLFRVLTPGVHPDVEVTRFLTTKAHFPNTPALFAETRIEAGEEAITTGMLQEYLPGAVDAWSFALERGKAFFTAPPQSGRDPANDVVPDARRLGVMTRAMHDALASGTDSAFTPEPLRAEDVERQAHRVQQSIRDSLLLLEAQLETGRLPAQRVAEARALARRADHYTDFVDEIVDTVGDDLGSRIRTHGDYHLGQVLHTKSDDFMVIDFEGEPARKLEERRAKMSPLRDVAGMLRSFSYAAATMAEGVARTLDVATRELRSARWERDVRAAFLDGYLAAGRREPLLPRDPDHLRSLVALFETEKVFYELTYELNNRPEWVGIPMKGIARLLFKSGKD